MNNETVIAEVQFYLLMKINEIEKAVAVVSCFGRPDQDLLDASYQTYWTTQYVEDSDVRVIDVSAISSVVAMAPDPRYGQVHNDGSEVNRYFLMEKPGLKLASMIGMDAGDGLELTPDL